MTIIEPIFPKHALPVQLLVKNLCTEFCENPINEYFGYYVTNKRANGRTRFLGKVFFFLLLTERIKGRTSPWK
jgi:hypothetical protein